MDILLCFCIAVIIVVIIEAVIDYQADKKLQREYEIERKNIELGVYENRREK